MQEELTTMTYSATRFSSNESIATGILTKICDDLSHGL